MALLAALGVLLYGHTLDVPWYLDDFPAIVDNPMLRDLATSGRHFFAPRGPVSFTFALNYHFGGDRPAGYHLVNLALHLGSSVVVLLLLRRVFRSAPWLSLAGALLFLAHPLQTQAVTYTVQRATVMAAGLALLALYAFVRQREATAPRPRRAWYLAALGAAALAVLCKENTVVLPLLLFLFDYAFLPRAPQPWRRRLIDLAPLALASLGGLALRLLPLLGGESLTAIAYGRGDVASATPLQYFVTEWGVLWTYLRLALLPVNQALDYQVPLAPSLASPVHLLAGAGLAGVLLLAWQLRQRRPAVAFGLAWFFVALAVESSFVPLDPLFEHRMYLPLFGLIVAALDLVATLPRRPVQTLVLALLLLVFALLSWQRNASWREPIAFYQDNLRLMPGNPRVWGNLADAYARAGRSDEALTVLRRGIEQAPAYPYFYRNLALLYQQRGAADQALTALDAGLRALPDSAELRDLTAQLLLRRGDLPRARALAEEALVRDPHFPPAYNTLGLIAYRSGQTTAAEAAFRRSIAEQRGTPDPVPLANLAQLLEGERRYAEALALYRRLLEYDPRHPAALAAVARLSPH